MNTALWLVTSAVNHLSVPPPALTHPFSHRYFSFPLPAIITTGVHERERGDVGVKLTPRAGSQRVCVWVWECVWSSGRVPAPPCRPVHVRACMWLNVCTCRTERKTAVNFVAFFVNFIHFFIGFLMFFARPRCSKECVRVCPRGSSSSSPLPLSSSSPMCWRCGISAALDGSN